jgi:hypothetical protein
MYGIETLGEKLSRVLKVKVPTVSFRTAKTETIQQKKERLAFLIEFQCMVNQEIGELFYQLWKEKASQ